MFLTFVVCLLMLLQAVNSATTQKHNPLDSKGTPCDINNNFYAWPSKKLENIILEINKKLDAIQEELRNSTKKENKTKG